MITRPSNLEVESTLDRQCTAYCQGEALLSEPQLFQGPEQQVERDKGESSDRSHHCQKIKETFCSSLSRNQARAVAGTELV